MSRGIDGPAGYTSQTRRILAIKAIAVAALALILVADSAWPRCSFAGNAMRAAGLCLVMAAVIGRLWATLYIGGLKNALLVTSGPYSITRNPLYVFSILGAAGIGLVFGSLLVAAMLSGAVAALLTAKARDEAVQLGARFGAAYAAYDARVPLLWPRASLYREDGVASFQPAALRRALRDGLLFPLSVPAAELVECARRAGMLPQLVPLF